MTAADASLYRLHTVRARPREWAAVGAAAPALRQSLAAAGGALFGAWRSQIGRARDEVTLITRWGADTAGDAAAEAALLASLPKVAGVESRAMRATLRPFVDAAAPVRQGNYAFRWFELPEANLAEFLDLCAAAWPGFEAAYDSQVIGLWRLEGRADAASEGRAEALLLTRRPDLAMWERSKLPEGPAEAEVRARLSRRYDLCDDTWVYTTTLLTADDRADEARWT